LRIVPNESQKTVINETVMIRQIVNFALSREMVSQNPLRSLQLTKAKPSPQPCGTRQEIDMLLAAADGHFRSALTILAETGMRIEELKHLTWEDVDANCRALRIRAKNGWIPKSGDERAIPLTPPIRQGLEGLVKKSRRVFTAQKTSRFPSEDRQLSERQLLQFLKRLPKKSTQNENGAKQKPPTGYDDSFNSKRRGQDSNLRTRFPRSPI
jgi:integrase